MATTSIGSKGSDVYTLNGVGNDLLALNAVLVRGASSSTIESLLPKIDDEDAFVLAFMTRAIRGGKGERDLFYEIYSVLLNTKRPLALDLLDLVGHYGYWGDLFALGEKHAHIVWPRLLEIVKKELSDPKSLIAKWMPREGRPLAPSLATALWTGPDNAIHSSKLRAYRKTVANLNKALATTEIAMCSGDWANIKPGRVPGRCMNQNRLAFLNEVAPKKKNQRVVKGTLRHPEDKGRMICRENFQKYFVKTASGQVKAKGSDTLYPHEVIRNICQNVSVDERNSLTGMWRSFVDSAVASGGLGRSIPMCDFSGSMSGLPLQVSRAMGLLISEITTDEFKNKMLTFDSEPKWLTFPVGSSIFERVNIVNKSGYGHGLSTDFQKAMDMVLSELKQQRVVPGKEPENLIVLTDMAWDAACGSSQTGSYTGNTYRHVVKTSGWQTHIQMIRESFKRAGEDMFGEGKGYKPPRIVIWNISASCEDMHAQASDEGVVMLSGWSPSLFKVLMTKGVEIKTPLDALRAQMNDPLYDIVRQRVAAYKRGSKE